MIVLVRPFSTTTGEPSGMVFQAPSTSMLLDKRITASPPMVYTSGIWALSRAAFLLDTFKSSSNDAPPPLPTVQDVSASPHHLHSESFTLNFMVLERWVTRAGASEIGMIAPIGSP